MKITPKKKFMEEAIKLAKQSAKKGEYAIGAVVVKNNKIIGKGMNSSFGEKDSSCHAEVVAMRKASKRLKNRYLKDCILYSTAEPCCMCVGLAIWCQLGGIVYGTNIKDMENYWTKRGNKKKLMSCKNILKGYGSSINVKAGFMREECKELFDIYP